jgi:hypothetical protein
MILLKVRISQLSRGHIRQLPQDNICPPAPATNNLQKAQILLLLAYNACLRSLAFLNYSEIREVHLFPIKNRSQR